MSVQQMFSVYDVKSEIFGFPMCSPTISSFARILSDLIAEGKHAFAQHPEDYVLFHLGEFHEQSGQIHLLPAPNSLFSLTTLTRQ